MGAAAIWTYTKQRYEDISRQQLQVSAWDRTTFHWLNHELNIDHALKSSSNLFNAIKLAGGE